MTEALQAGGLVIDRSLPGLDLAGAALRETDLLRVDLSGSDLRGADFSGAVLHRVRLDRAALAGCRFAGCLLSEVDLRAADPGALDHAVVLGGVWLPGADEPTPNQDGQGEALAALEELLRPEPMDEECRKAALMALLAAAPGWYRVHRGLGDLWRRLGDLHSARFYYERALTLSPEDPAAALGLAETCLELGDVAAATGLLRGLLDRDPDDQAARLAMARLHEREERWDLALEHLEAALEAAPEDVDLMVRTAAAAANLGHVHEALTLLDRAMELAPERTELLLHLSELCVRALDMPMEGLEALVPVLQRDPKDPRALALLVGLLLDLWQVDAADRVASLVPEGPGGLDPGIRARLLDVTGRWSELLDLARELDEPALLVRALVGLGRVGEARDATTRWADEYPDHVPNELAAWRATLSPGPDARVGGEPEPPDVRGSGWGIPPGTAPLGDDELLAEILGAKPAARSAGPPVFTPRGTIAQEVTIRGDRWLLELLLTPVQVELVRGQAVVGGGPWWPTPEITEGDGWIAAWWPWPAEEPGHHRAVAPGEGAVQGIEVGLGEAQEVLHGHRWWRLLAKDMDVEAATALLRGGELLWAGPRPFAMGLALASAWAVAGARFLTAGVVPLGPTEGPGLLAMDMVAHLVATAPPGVGHEAMCAALGLLVAWRLESARALLAPVEALPGAKENFAMVHAWADEALEALARGQVAAAMAAVDGS